MSNYCIRAAAMFAFDVVDIKQPSSATPRAGNSAQSGVFVGHQIRAVPSHVGAVM